MFSVQQKRDIADAVQKILRDTNHPELPKDGVEIWFTLKVVGAESWSWAEIANNAAVTNPGMNPHNELMAELPEEEARGLIDKAQSLPDPRATPEEFLKEMMKAEITQLNNRLNSLVKAVEGFAQNVVTESSRIDKHDDQIRNIMTALRPKEG